MSNYPILGERKRWGVICLCPMVIYMYEIVKYFNFFWGWSGVAKVSCILRHRGVHSYFFCLFTFTTVLFSPLSLYFISSTISYISVLPYSLIKPPRNTYNFFSETACLSFTNNYITVEGMLTICSNGSALLNKVAAMPI